MSAPQLIHDTPNFVFWELPLGKPDPNAVCSPETLKNDTRPRVRQNVKKNTCWYTSLKTICLRIGKHPTSELAFKRMVEQMCSSWRKDMTKHELSLPEVFMDVEEEDVKQGWTSWDHKRVSEILSNTSSYEQHKTLFDSSKARGDGPSAFPFLQKFLDQTLCQNFYEYVKYTWQQPKFEINATFLRSFGANPDALLLDPSNSEQNSTNSSSFDEKGMILSDNLVKCLMSHLFELKESSWAPNQQLPHLISELKARGPLVIAGLFGTSFYSTDPFIMNEKIAERSIYAWPPGTKSTSSSRGHTITVIGARKCDNKELVYYVDPLDPSDPKDITAQKIYAISYRSFKESVINLAGAQQSIEHEELKFLNTYALAAPKPPKN